MSELNSILARLKSDYDKTQAQAYQEEAVASQRRPPPLKQALATRGNNMLLALAKTLVQDPTSPIPSLGIGGTVVRPQDIVLPTGALYDTGDSKLNAILKAFKNYYTRSWGRPNDIFVKALDEGKEITKTPFSAEPWNYENSKLSELFGNSNYTYARELLRSKDPEVREIELEQIESARKYADELLLRPTETAAKTDVGKLYEVYNDLNAIKSAYKSNDPNLQDWARLSNDEQLTKFLQSDYYKKHRGTFDIYMPNVLSDIPYKTQLANELPYENYLTETRRSLPDFINSLVSKYSKEDNLKTKEFLTEGLKEVEPSLNLGKDGTWYKLLNNKANWAEGKKQHNCVGNLCQNERTNFYSFRKDPKQPLLTAQISNVEETLKAIRNKDENIRRALEARYGKALKLQKLQKFFTEQASGFANKELSDYELSLVDQLLKKLNETK